MSPMMEPALNGGSPTANCTSQSLLFLLFYKTSRRSVVLT